MYDLFIYLVFFYHIGTHNWMDACLSIHLIPVFEVKIYIYAILVFVCYKIVFH